MSEWSDKYTDIEVLGWMDLEGNRYNIENTGEELFQNFLSSGNVDGVLFTAKNPNDNDDSHTYWTYQTDRWWDWEDILEDIEVTLDMYEELSG